MNRIEKLNQHLKYWQIFFNLQEWGLKIKQTPFQRTDWPQSGDIEVDLKNKKAVILISEKETGKDNAIILHELIHLLLWEYDHFCEKFIDKNNKKHYFVLLEKIAADLENIFLQQDE